MFHKIFHSQKQKDKKKRKKKKKKRIWRSESQKKSVSPPYKEKNQLALRVTLLRREKTILTRRNKNSTAWGKLEEKLATLAAEKLCTNLHLILEERM